MTLHITTTLSSGELIKELDIDERSARLLMFEDIDIVTGTMAKHIKGVLEPFFQSATARMKLADHRFRTGVSNAALDRNEQSICYILGPSHSGKSHLAKHFAFKVAPKIFMGEGFMAPELVDGGAVSDTPKAHETTLNRNIAYVSLRGATNLKGAVSQILSQGFSDPGSVSTAQRGVDRIARLARSHRTPVVVIDEAQHLLNSANTKKDPQVTDFLKSLVITGQYSILLVGQEEPITRLLKGDEQFDNRSTGVILGPHAVTGDGWMEFQGFLGYLDRQMVAKGIFSERSGLLTDGMAGLIHEASFGLVGRAYKLLHRALNFHVEVGAPCLTKKHLEVTVDAYPTLLARLHRNPFKKGGAGRSVDLREVTP